MADAIAAPQAVAGLRFALRKGGRSPNSATSTVLVPALLKLCFDFIHRSGEMTITAADKDIFAGLLEAQVLAMLPLIQQREVAATANAALARLERILEARQVELAAIGKLTEGVNEYFPHTGRDGDTVDHGVDQRDAIPAALWKWIEVRMLAAVIVSLCRCVE
jgi:hypothetical protein